MVEFSHGHNLGRLIPLGLNKNRPKKSFVKWSFPGQSLSCLKTSDKQFWIGYKRQPGADDQRGPVYALTQPIDATGIKACTP